MCVACVCIYEQKAEEAKVVDAVKKTKPLEESKSKITDGPKRGSATMSEIEVKTAIYVLI